MERHKQRKNHDPITSWEKIGIPAAGAVALAIVVLFSKQEGKMAPVKTETIRVPSPSASPADRMRAVRAKYFSELAKPDKSKIGLVPGPHMENDVPFRGPDAHPAVMPERIGPDVP